MARFFLVMGIITMVLSGGCSLWALGSIDDQYVTLDAILVIGGVPFGIGLLVVFLANIAQRRKEAREHEKIHDRWKSGQ